MELWRYEGRTVRVATRDGSIFEGLARDYTSALDNEPHGACISVGIHELLESEIAQIRAID